MCFFQKKTTKNTARAQRESQGIFTGTYMCLKWTKTKTGPKKPPTRGVGAFFGGLTNTLHHPKGRPEVGPKSSVEWVDPGVALLM